MIFILTCSPPPPCKRGGSRTPSSVLTCFLPLGLSIPCALLKRTALYRSFCQSRSAGGLLFLGLKGRSSFAAGCFVLGTDCPDGLTLVHGRSDQGNQVDLLKDWWGCSCACEPGWHPVLQPPQCHCPVAPGTSVAHPSWRMALSGSRLSTCLEQPVGDAAPALGERMQPFVPFVSCIMGFDLTGPELSLFLQKWLVKHTLCSHLQGILGLSAGEKNQKSFVDLTVRTSLNTYTKSLWHYSKKFEKTVLNFSSNTPVCVWVNILDCGYINKCRCLFKYIRMSTYLIYIL